MSIAVSISTTLLFSFRDIPLVRKVLPSVLASDMHKTVISILPCYKGCKVIIIGHEPTAVQNVSKHIRDFVYKEHQKRKNPHFSTMYKICKTIQV